MNRYEIDKALREYADEQFNQLGIVPGYGDYSCGRRKAARELSSKLQVRISEKSAWKALSYMTDRFYERYALGIPPRRFNSKIVDAQQMSVSSYEERHGIDRLEYLMENKNYREMLYLNRMEDFDRHRYIYMAQGVDVDKKKKEETKWHNDNMKKLNKEIALEEAKNRAIEIAASDTSYLKDMPRLRQLVINEAGEKIKPKDILEVYRDAIRMAYIRKNHKELDRNLNLREITDVILDL